MNARSLVTVFSVSGLLAVSVLACSANGSEDDGVAEADIVGGGAVGSSCGTRGVSQCGQGLACVWDVQAACGKTDQPGHCLDPRVLHCAELIDPVCGCDGKTYMNTCKASALGVSVASVGSCAGGDATPSTLEIELWREGARLTPVSAGDGLTTYKMRDARFEIRFAKPANDEALSLNTWVDDSVRIVDGAPVGSSPFADGKGMAAQPGILLLSNDRHTELFGPHIETTEDGQVVSAVKGFMSAADPIQHLPEVYLTAFIDKNGDRRFASGEHARIKIQFE